MFRCRSAPSSGSSRSGERTNGAPLCQRPTILAPSSASSSRLAALLAQIAPVGGDAGVQLAEDDVGAVPAEHVRARHRRQAPGLVRVAEDDLARLERRLAGVRAGDAAALDGGLSDPVLEAEGGPSCGQLVAVLTPDHLDPGELFVRRARALEHRFQPGCVRRQRGERHVDVGGPERLLPVGRAALADVAQLGCPRGHPLPKLRREAVQRVLRHTERLQPLVGESSGDPGVLGRIGGRPAGIDD